MRKIIMCLLLGVLVCGSAISVRPAEAMMGGDWETGDSIGRTIWGTIKGCYKAWNAPEGRKWESFKDGYKEGTEGVEGDIFGTFGGTIAK